MKLTVTEAASLAVRALTRHGMSRQHAEIVAEHLIDSALCGHEFSSLPRVVAVIDELRRKPPPGEIRVVRESPTSALIDGGDNVAYVVSIAAIDKAIEICRKSGVAIVSVNNTWYSGRLSYYVERAARQGFVAMHTTNTTARVAPFGGIDRILGTNPLAIAFPGEDDPLVIDLGTSTTWGHVLLAKAKGEPLEPGIAVDPGGQPTVDPDAAIAGAFLPWGGNRGSGLSVAIQLLGILAGSPIVIEDVRNWGLFFLVFDPRLIMPGNEFRARVSELRRVISSSRPAPGVGKVRAPGDGSLQNRKRSTPAGVIHLDDRVYSRILELSA